MKKCIGCGDIMYSDDLMCHRCKESGVRTRLEIYDNLPEQKKPAHDFSKTFLGDFNYKKMQRKNLERGGFG